VNHPTAIIEKGAEIDPTAEIGPWCRIGPRVRIGAGTVLQNGVTVGGRTTLGRNNAVHPYCVIGGDPQDLKYRGEDSETSIGDGNTLRECVTVNKGTDTGSGKTVIGNRNMIMACAHVAHDVEIEDQCILANAVLLAGHVRVEKHAIISGQVCISHFCTVGQHAFIGGASALNQDAPPYMISRDVPSKVAGVNTVGLRRRGFPPETINALRECHRILWRSDAPKPESMARVEQEFGEIPEVRVLLDFLRAADRGRLGRAREAFRTTPVAPDPEADLLE